jgi:MFS transporter, AAHS family, 4-hydroxybenzoate transporter
MSVWVSVRQRQCQEVCMDSSPIDVGKIIDDSKLNKVSVITIVLCGLVMIMDGFDFQLMAQAAPTIMREWKVNTDRFGIVFSAVAFGYLFGAIICGALSDKIGRKKTLILGASVFSIGTLLIYFSNSVGDLIVMRIFSGMGIGGAVPCALTLTSEYSPAKGRGKYVSIMYSGFLIGIVLAGYVSAFLLKSKGWRPLFLVGFFAPLLIILLLALLLPESARWLAIKYKSEKQRQALIRTIKSIQPDFQLDAQTQFVSTASKNEQYAIGTLFEGRLAKVTPLIWAFYLISSIPLFFISSWAPKLLVEKGFADSTAAFISGNIGILVAVGCLLSGFYYDKLGFRRGWILYVIAGICLICLGGRAPIGFVVVLCAGAFFINGAHMAITILAPIVYPSKCRNQGAGTAIAVARIGAISGPYIGGILLATEMSRERVMALVAIPLLIAAALCYFAGRQYDVHSASEKHG